MAFAGPEFEIDLRLDIGSGWDSNVYWSLGDDPGHLSPNRSADVPPEVDDGLFAERPGVRFTVWPGWRHRIDLRWQSDLRHYFHQGFAQYHRPRARYRYRMWHQLYLRLGADGEGFFRQKYSAERYYGAGGNAGFSWMHPLLFRFSVHYLFKWRRYPDPDRETDGLPQQDLGYGVEIKGSVRVHRRVQLGLGYAFLWTDSDKDFHDRASHLWLGTVRLDLPRNVKLEVFVAGQHHRLDRYHESGGGSPGERRDLLVSVGGRFRWRPLHWLSVWASYGFTYLDIDFQDLDRSTHRQLALAGIGVCWRKSWTRKRRGAPTIRPVKWSPSAHPAKTGPGRWVTFRLHAPRAKRVSVVGSFNQWNAARGLLKKTGKRWTGTFRLLPGRYTYTFTVDGRTLHRPPGARSYVSDGFGGYNGVLTVK